MMPSISTKRPGIRDSSSLAPFQRTDLGGGLTNSIVEAGYNPSNVSKDPAASQAGSPVGSDILWSFLVHLASLTVISSPGQSVTPLHRQQYASGTKISSCIEKPHFGGHQVSV